MQHPHGLGRWGLMQNLCCCCCPCSLAALGAYRTSANNIFCWAMGLSHPPWCQNTPPYVIGYLFPLCRDCCLPDWTSKGKRTSLGPGKTLQGAPPLSLLLRPSKHRPRAESEREGAESPALMFISRCVGQPSDRAGCCATGIWSH